MLLVLRVIHIFGGAFWVGTMFFTVFFLEPSVREAGPDGAKVMQGLMRRKFVIIMPVIAVLTILAGVGLLEQASGGFHPDWMSSRTGITLSLGALTAILAFLIGVVVVRPSMARMGPLMAQAAQTADAAAKGALMSQVQSLQSRMRVASRVIVLLLGITVVTMAVARYLQ
jgi:uncharacterized membrane protein